MPKKPIKLAVFDIDGTIFRSSLVIELIRELIRIGVFPHSVQKQMEREYVAWLNRKGTYEDYLEQVISVYYHTIKGKNKHDVDLAIRNMLRHRKDRVYRYTRDLVKKYKNQGFYLLTISGSPIDVVAPFAKHLGFDTAYGRIFSIKDGRYTGKVLNQRIMNEAKDEIIREFLEEKGLTIDRKNSVAVGDTETDIAMLKFVGKPIAFNPNMNLMREAKKRGWPIVVERKDVIYHLNNFTVDPGVRSGRSIGSGR